MNIGDKKCLKCGYIITVEEQKYFTENNIIIDDNECPECGNIDYKCIRTI